MFGMSWAKFGISACFMNQMIIFHPYPDKRVQLALCSVFNRFFEKGAYLMSEFSSFHNVYEGYDCAVYLTYSVQLVDSCRNEAKHHHPAYEI